MDVLAPRIDSERLSVGSNATLLPIAVCAVVGYIACQFESSYIFSVYAVLMWGVARSRLHAYLYIVIYTGFSTWVVVPAIIDYLSWHPVHALLFWCIGMPLAMLPWALLYRRDGRYIEIRLLAVMVLTWIPPIGAAQFASPFVGTSLLVPGFGVVSIAIGLLMTGFLTRVIRARWYNCVGFIAVPVIAFNFLMSGEKIPDWIAVDTAVKVGGIVHTIEGSMDALTQVKSVARDKKPRVAVLGESTGGYSIGAGERVLRSVLGDTVILAGGRIDEKQAVFKWSNDGDSAAIYHQRLRPILLEPQDGKIDGNKTALVDGLLIAPLICYEGSVPYPIFLALLENPDAIVSMANFHWSRNDLYFSRVLRAHIGAWGRIWNVPTLVAINTAEVG